MNLRYGWAWAGVGMCWIVACSGNENGNDSGSGGTGSGGVVAGVGGQLPSSGGNSSGGTASGGTASGGASSGGSSTGGGSATGGASNGGAETGGSDGEGGEGGSQTSGSVCGPQERGTNVAQGTCALINDFEGEDEYTASIVLDADGREGSGIDFASPGVPRLSLGKYNSGAGTLEVVEESGNSFLRFEFLGAQAWGGTFAYMLSNDACYDASEYQGISLRARSHSGDELLKVAVVTADSNPLYDCDEEEGCYNHGTLNRLVDDQWTTLDLYWEDFAHPGWGAEWGDEIDPTRILALVLGDGDTDSTELDELDIAIDIDDIEFIGGGLSSCVSAE